MRVLLVHNTYQYRGGEDVAFESECRVLQEAGHQVETYLVDNDAVASSNPLATALKTVWNSATQKALSRKIEAFRPDVAHFHNTFPLVSPSGYRACRQWNVPVVQTLHNYRLICPNALLFRDGRVCQDCVGKGPWRGVWHRCYRKSLGASAATAAMLSFHRARGTYQRDVDLYLAVSDFQRDLLVAGGLQPEKVMVKPNFLIDDPGAGAGGDYALLLGRLSVEKGTHQVMQAWSKPEGLPPLVILGTGPLESEVARWAKESGQQYLGAKERDKALEWLKGAAFLVAASQCYESAPFTIIEALACGTPVLAPDQGAIATMVDPGRTATLFRFGDPHDIRAKAAQMAANPKRDTMRQACRERFEERYSRQAGLEALLAAYQRAIDSARR